MTRSTRTAAVVAFSLAMAGLASLSAYKAMAPQAATPASDDSKPVVIAARPVPIGRQLTPDDLRTVGWPARHVVPGAVHDIASAVGLTVVAPLMENEPLTNAKLATREAGAGLPPAIPAGMRAISVKVNEVIGVAGFVAPNTLVDVLVAVRSQLEARSRVVVSNVRVLTAGTRQEQSKGEASSPTSVVTLLVSPTESERIALASMEGQIMLALRNPFDRDVPPTPGATLTGMMSGPGAPSTPSPNPPQRRAAFRPEPVIQPAPVERPYVVEAIRAAKRSEEVVR